MMLKYRLKNILLLMLVFAPVADAGVYIGLGTSFLQVKADTGSTAPMTADISVGYEKDVHKVELMLKTGISDDNLNQMVTEVPVASSLLYRFTINPRNSLHIDLILGYSQVDVTASYIDVPAFTESYSGVSFGFGLEEKLKSIPQLKFRFDFIQLYRGDQLKLNTFNLGFRYAF